MRLYNFENTYDLADFVRKNGNGRNYCYILCENGEPFYVGISKKPGRPTDHLFEAIGHRGSNTIKEARIRKIINTGGVVSVKLIGFFQNILEVNHAEKSLIAFYGKICNKTGILTNILDGGDGSCGRPASEKQKKRLREIMTGKYRSEETRKRLSQSLKEYYKHNHSTFKGKKHTEETRRLMSINHSGSSHPQFGRRGPDCHNFGKKHSEDTRNKIKQALSNLDMSCTEKRKQQLKDYWASQPVLKCPHCGKESSFKPSMVRAHFDNCKHKEIKGN